MSRLVTFGLLRSRAGSPCYREFGFIVFVRAVSVAVGNIRFAAVHGLALGAHATVLKAEFAAIPGSNLLKSRTGGVSLRSTSG